MGTCYIVVDDKRRVYFEMDKAYELVEALDPTIGAPIVSEYPNHAAYKQAQAAWAQSGFTQWQGRPQELKARLVRYIEEDRPDYIEHWERTAKRLYQFCEDAGWENLRLIADHSDEYYDITRGDEDDPIRDEARPPYTKIASRYDEPIEPLVEVAMEKLGMKKPPL